MEELVQITRFCIACDKELPVSCFYRRLNQCRDCRRKIDLQSAAIRHADLDKLGPDATKKCATCGLQKPLSDFTKSRTGTLGRYSYCKQCNTIHRRVRAYGMTHEEYSGMVALQDGLCLICGIAPAVYVDHDHAHGNVRSILCSPCNMVLGVFNDDPERFRRAAIYLEQHEMVRQ